MRRKALTVSVLAVCLALLVHARQSQPQVTIARIAGPVYMLQGGGGNIGIVADPAGLLMIDAMEDPVAPEIRTAVKSLPGGGSVRVLVNTHWHGDHTDGNRIFGPGAAIIAHEHVRPLLAKSQTLLGQQTRSLPPEALPNITYSDRLMTYAGGEAIRLVHYPHAHTDGDTVVFIDALKVVHMGDMFFNGMFPFLDVDNGGDIRNWVRQLDTILVGLPADAKIIPGHGPLGSPSDLKAFRQMLADSADVVGGQMKAGKTLDEIKAAGLPDRFAPWTKGFLTTGAWLELVYRSLEKQKPPATEPGQ